MRDGAADRALVAGLEMADERQGGRQQGKLPRKRRPCQQPALSNCGADLDPAIELANDIELGNARDIDQDDGLDHTQIEHGQQRLAAGENWRHVAVLGQDRDRFLDRIRPRIIERTRLHRTVSRVDAARSGSGLASAPAISAWMRRGVAGSSTSRTPSASAMALAMQGGTLMQLPSAAPLAPSGVSGDGVS